MPAWMGNCCVYLLLNMEFEKLDAVQGTVANANHLGLSPATLPMSQTGDLDVRGRRYRGQLPGTIQPFSFTATKVQESWFWFPLWFRCQLNREELAVYLLWCEIFCILVISPLAFKTFLHRCTIKIRFFHLSRVEMVFSFPDFQTPSPYVSPLPVFLLSPW